MNTLFGMDLPTSVNFVIAFVVVLGLIGAATWLVRRFGATRLDPTTRGRQPRLAVIDSASVDARRKLVIIRRDNVEHLLMIGGPSDVVVETNIVRAAAATSARETAARGNGSDPTLRAVPLADQATWPLQPEATPAVAYIPHTDRGPRIAGDDEPHWQSQTEADAVPMPAPRMARPADPATNYATEPHLVAIEPSLAPRAPQPEMPQHIDPQPAAVAQTRHEAGPPIVPPADQSLAEMAMRLEAALRRPSPQKIAAEGGTAHVAIASGTAAKPARDPKVAVITPKGGALPKPQPQPQPQQNDLEQEMASLINRPGKT